MSAPAFRRCRREATGTASGRRYNPLPRSRADATQDVWRYAPVGARINPRPRMPSSESDVVPGLEVTAHGDTVIVSKARLELWCRHLRVSMRKPRSLGWGRDYSADGILREEMPRVLTELCEAAYGRPDAWEVVTRE